METMKRPEIKVVMLEKTDVVTTSSGCEGDTECTHHQCTLECECVHTHTF